MRHGADREISSAWHDSIGPGGRFFASLTSVSAVEPCTELRKCRRPQATWEIGGGRTLKTGKHEDGIGEQRGGDRATDESPGASLSQGSDCKIDQRIGIAGRKNSRSARNTIVCGGDLDSQGRQLGIETAGRAKLLLCPAHNRRMMSECSPLPEICMRQTAELRPEWRACSATTKLTAW